MSNNNTAAWRSNAMSEQLIETGSWGKNVTWELRATTILPPENLCTAVMCVAVSMDNRVVLARSKRGWGLLGGHIESGESLEEALHREAYEEGGFLIDEHQLFAVRKITSTAIVPHPNPDMSYPFPVSYMTYHWATTQRPLEMPTGEEIIERKSYGIDEVALTGTQDQTEVGMGWEALAEHLASRIHSSTS